MKPTRKFVINKLKKNKNVKQTLEIFFTWTAPPPQWLLFGNLFDMTIKFLILHRYVSCVYSIVFKKTLKEEKKTDRRFNTTDACCVFFVCQRQTL